MPYDLSAFQGKVAATIGALGTTPAPKDLLLIAKAIEGTTPSVALSDVLAAANTGVTNINGAASGALSDITTAQAAATSAVGTARTSAVSAVNTARDQAVQAVRDQQGSGASTTAANVAYTPGGSLTATNVQAALGQLDTLKVAKSANLSDLADPKAARANLGFEKQVSRGDAAYTIQPGDRTVMLTAALTAPRTLTLPAASAMNPGASLRIADLVGGVSAANTLTIAATGSDTINGATAFTFATPYTDFQITADGAGKWVFDVQAVARGGTGATTAAGARTNLGLKGAALLEAAVAGGVATLDASTGKLVAAQIPDALLGAVRYQGGWNASTNSPALPAPSAANKGWYYIVTVAGTTGQPGPFGTISEWAVGDWIISDGTYWEKVDSTDQVTSVAGLVGAITAAALTGALNAFVPDTGSAAGTKGLVPASSAGDAAAGKVLTAGGWGFASFASLAAAAIGTVAEILADAGSKLLSVAALWDAHAPVPWAYSATFTPNMNTFLTATMTLTGNLTLANPTNPKPGQAGEIVLTQDATGGRTVSYGSAWKFVGGTPTASTAAGAVDVISYRVISANLIIASFGKGVA